MNNCTNSGEGIAFSRSTDPRPRSVWFISIQTLRRFLTVSSFRLALGVLSPAVASAATNGTNRPLTGSSTSTTTINLATGAAIGDGVSVVSHCGKTTFHNDMTFTITGPDSFHIVGTDTE